MSTCGPNMAEIRSGAGCGLARAHQQKAIHVGMSMKGRIATRRASDALGQGPPNGSELEGDLLSHVFGE